MVNINNIGIKMNRKAMVLKTILGLVIALILFVGLIFLAGRMYCLFIKPGVNEQAKATLNEMVNEIEGLEEGDEKSYLVLNPEDWVLILEGDKLIMCDSSHFFSISRIVTGHESRAVKIKNCLENGVSQKVNVGIDIPHKCVEDNCIVLEELPLDLILRKTNEVVTITKKDSDGFVSYRINSESRSILEIMKELVLDLSNIELKSELEGVIESYVGEGKVYWILRIYKSEGEEGARSIFRMVGNELEYYSSDELVKEEFVFAEGDKNYQIEFKKGAYLDGRGRS